MLIVFTYCHANEFSTFLSDRLPAWANMVFGPGTEFEHASNRYFQIYTMTPELARLNYGFLLRDILDRFDEKIQGTLTPNRSLWIYFAHDTTIGSILNMLGLFDVITILNELISINQKCGKQILFVFSPISESSSPVLQ